MPIIVLPLPSTQALNQRPKPLDVDKVDKQFLMSLNLTIKSPETLQSKGSQYFEWVWVSEQDKQFMPIWKYRGANWQIIHSRIARIKDLANMHPHNISGVFQKLDQMQLCQTSKIRYLGFLDMLVHKFKHFRQKMASVSNDWRVEMGLVDEEDPQQIRDIEREEEGLMIIELWRQCSAMYGLKKLTDPQLQVI